jgi:hypothetical protein
VFRHHAHEKPMTEAERDTLLREGAVIQGMVMHNELSAADPRISVVRVTVRFKDDQRVEFSEELANLYQPEPGSPEARRLAEVREARQRPKAQPATQPPARPGARTGPPWVVPAHCPNCGAPVDQAKASRDPDPQCQFCHQPVPVQPPA